jgi:hypothetical protein
MEKFGFAIKTRDGQTVDGLFISGRDQADAERKLRQMYRHCEILRCSMAQTVRRGQGVEVEELLSLIAKECAAIR